MEEIAYTFLLLCVREVIGKFISNQIILKTQKEIVKRQYFLLCANWSYVSTVSFVTYYCIVLQTNINVTPALNKCMF